MIELISAAKVGKISETNVSLPEKYVSNQENFFLKSCNYQIFFLTLPSKLIIINKLSL
jgi:hypothetical protein